MQDPNVRPYRTVQHVSGYKRLLVLPVAWLIRLLLCTLRINLSEEAISLVREKRQSMILAIWHNRLMVTSELRRRCMPDQAVGGLVSASKDGAWLAYLFEMLGILAVRGSSSFRSKQAFRELLQLHSQGVHLALTPDGPRGPIYHFQRGVSELARVSNSALFLIGIRYHSCWKLSSWDQFRIPKPWSRVTVSVKVIEPQDPIWEREDKEQLFQQYMLELNGE